MSMKQQMVKAAMGIALVFAFAMPAAAQDVKIGVVSLQDVVQRAPQTASASTVAEMTCLPAANAANA